jgi:hypothetical protein
MLMGGAGDSLSVPSGTSCVIARDGSGTLQCATPLSKSQGGAGPDMTCGGAVNIDLTTGDHVIIVTSSLCVPTFINPVAGERVFLLLVQGGSGSYTVTWPNNITWLPYGASAPALPGAVGSYMAIACKYETSYGLMCSAVDNGSGVGFAIPQCIADGIHDCTLAIQAAVDSLSKGDVLLSDGTYLTSDTITISNPRVSIIGAGQQASILKFNPTTDGKAAIAVKLPTANTIPQVSLKGFAIGGTGDTHVKTAIRVTDGEEIILDDIAVSNFTSSSPSTTPAIGLQFRGRQTHSISHVTINTDLPVSIETNPNSSISIDHYHFHDCYFIAALTQPIINIASGVNLTYVTFDGYQAWVQGKHGLYWNDTTTSSVSIGLSLKNVKWEQATDNTGYLAYINHNYGLYQFSMENIYGGLNSNGLYLRKVTQTALSNLFYIGALTALDLNSTVDRVNFSDVTFNNPVATVTTTGATNLMGSYYLGGTRHILPLPQLTFTNDAAATTLSTDLTTNGRFTVDLSSWSGTNWAWEAGNDGQASHTAGSTAALTQNITVVNGTTYQVEVSITGRTVGSVAVSIGSVYIYDYSSTFSLTQNTTYKRTLVAPGTGSQPLNITPTADFDGAITSISVRAVSFYASSYLNLMDNLGSSALELRGTASLHNTSVGLYAGQKITNGERNTFVGNATGANNTTGYYNTFLGQGAGDFNTTGYDNTLLGMSAGYSNTTGQDNTFVGLNSGYTNTTGNTNTFVGKSAGLSNTTGLANAFYGTNAGFSNTSGYANTFFGESSGFSNNTGNYNVFVGFKAGYNETGSNKLYICNSDTACLIKGDFYAGHINNGTGTTAPTLSSCGTSPSIATGSTDHAGKVTIGAIGTGCTITFAVAYTNAPSCLVGGAVATTWTTTNTALMISASPGVIDYHCIGLNE